MIDIKGFKLDATGDVEMKHNRIQMIEGNEVLRQRIWSVLSTNKGEWVLNTDEGINFRNILGKRSNLTESKEDKALKQYYENMVDNIEEDVSALAKRLEQRLDGVTDE